LEFPCETTILARMKIVAIIVRVLLGLLFVVAGVLHFIHTQPMSGPSGEFIGAMNATGYLQAVAALEVLGGLLLLIGFIPLGLLTLGPIIVNIVFFHAFMYRAGLGMALCIAALSLFLLYYHRSSFAGLLVRSRS
jgi:putative oxidoreductase